MTTLHLQCDPNWKSILYNLPKGTMKFLINSLINTLPTQDNLKLWGKTFSDKCHLCKNRDSTKHCLSACKIALEQGRYTWRHNNVVNYIVTNLDSSKYRIHSDLPGYQASNGGSLPPSILVTPLKPDIVIIEENTKKAFIYELTVPYESNIERQHKYKEDKYAHFQTDIKTHNTSMTAFEVGARGTITPDNMKRLHSIHKHMKKSISKSTFINNIKALVTQSCYYIFTARKHPTWDNTDYINPPF